MRKSLRALRALVVAAHIASPYGALPAFALAGGVKLPAPAVSKALDAILLPIDATVAREFKLAGKSGLLVLAVQPGGVADKQGIEPGDVLVEVAGKKVSRPIDVDLAVRRGLKGGTTNYSFGVNRGGAIVAVAAVITLALYEESFSISEISSWESWSTSTSFSYSEFVSEYSETIETSYESEETTIEQEISKETTTTEESTKQDSTSEDSDHDGTPDATDADDDNDGTPDDADTDDDGDGVEDAAETDADDGDADNDGTPDDADTDDDNDGTPDDADTDDDGDGVDDSAEEDDGGDDSADDGGDDGADDGGDDDGGGDEGGDDGE